MKIILLRHGEAERFASSDSQRCLTEIGRKETVSICQEWLRDLKATTHLLVSPYVRAQQTSELVLSVIGARESVTCDHITPDSDPFQAIEAIETLQSEKSAEQILVVSHMPLVGLLCNYYIHGQLRHYSFSTSSFVGIDFSVLGPGCGSKLWHRHPE